MTGGRIRVVGPGTAPGSTVTPADLLAHENDVTDAHDASAVSVVPFGSVAATDVQAALQEIVTEEAASHPNLATHDALGLATDAEAATHAALTTHIRVSEPSPRKFVSTTGDDAFDGRWDRPLLTWGAAVTALGSGGGIVDMAPGTFAVTDTLTVGAVGVTKNNIAIVGAGKEATKIQPNSAFGSKPVIKFINGAGCSVQNLGILGNNVTSIQAAIECRVDTQGTESASRFLARDLWLGDTGQHMQYGLRWTGATDTNNDFATIENCDIFNYTQAAISFEHLNSLGHRIIGGMMYSSASGVDCVRTKGGGFVWMGTVIINADGAILSCLAPTTIDYYTHPIQMSGLFVESYKQIVKTTADKQIQVYLTNCDFGGSVTGARNAVDFLGIAGSDGPSIISFVNCFIGTGQSGQTFNVADSSTKARIIACKAGWDALTWAGDLVTEGVYWTGGAPTETPGGSATRRSSGDSISTGPLASRGGQLYKSGAGVVTVSDADYTYPPPDGTTAVARNSTTNQRYLCTRANGTWTTVETS